jgi:hypothetical protein
MELSQRTNQGKEKEMNSEYDNQINGVDSFIRPLAFMIAILLVAELFFRYQYNAPTCWQWVGLVVAILIWLLSRAVSSILVRTCEHLFCVSLIGVLWIASVIQYFAIEIWEMDERDQD